MFAFFSKNLLIYIVRTFSGNSSTKRILKLEYFLIRYKSFLEKQSSKLNVGSNISEKCVLKLTDSNGIRYSSLHLHYLFLISSVVITVESICSLASSSIKKDVECFISWFSFLLQ